MNQAQQLLSEPQRQSPLAVVFLAIRALRALGVSQVAIFLVFASQAPVPGGLFALVPVVILALLTYGVLAWWKYTFQVANDELLVVKGVLSDDRLSLPLDRVQSVSIEQQFLHRIVGLVEVSVDSAGTSDTEFKIDAVDRKVAEALRSVAAEQLASTSVAEAGDADAGSFAPPPPVVPDRVLLRRSPSDLVKIAISQSPFAGLAFALPILALQEQIRERIPLPTARVEELFERDIGLWVVPVLFGVVATALVVGTIVLLIRELLTNWNLTLTMTPSGLRRSAGLLSKTSRASSVPRIQRFDASQNVIQRWFSISTVRLPTVGGEGGAGSLVLPGASDAEIEQLRGELLDEPGQFDVLRRELSPLLVFLQVRNMSVLLAIAIVGLAFSPIGWWGLVLLAGVPWTWFKARRHHRLTRWEFSDNALRLHKEVFTQHEVDMAFRKLQVASVSRSLFERKRNLATLRLAGTSGRVAIRLIDHDLAKQVRDLALLAAETDQRSWM